MATIPSDILKLGKPGSNKRKQIKAGDVSLGLPITQGSQGQTLINDGHGNCDWETLRRETAFLSVQSSQKSIFAGSRSGVSRNLLNVWLSLVGNSITFPPNSHWIVFGHALLYNIFDIAFPNSVFIGWSEQNGGDSSSFQRVFSGFSNSILGANNTVHAKNNRTDNSVRVETPPARLIVGNTPLTLYLNIRSNIWAQGGHNNPRGNISFFGMTSIYCERLD